MNERRMDIMTWADGQPCSRCGTPVNPIIHSFEVSKRVYHAPLYHLTDDNVGFCGPVCATAYMLDKIGTANDNSQDIR
jgi:hypothetical protein